MVIINQLTHPLQFWCSKHHHQKWLRMHPFFGPLCNYEQFTGKSAGSWCTTSWGHITATKLCSNLVEQKPHSYLISGQNLNNDSTLILAKQDTGSYFEQTRMRLELFDMFLNGSHKSLSLIKITSTRTEVSRCITLFKAGHGLWAKCRITVTWIHLSSWHFFCGGKANKNQQRED